MTSEIREYQIDAENEYTAQRQAVIDWLLKQGYPPLPVAPIQDPQRHHKLGKADPQRRIWEHCPVNEKLQPLPLFTGKNPSYLDAEGKPHLVNHRQYQKRSPSNKELQQWFSNPVNGVGTLGGWNNTTWLDFDVKCFASQDECDAAVTKILQLDQLQGTFVERSHSGGWRIGVKVKNWPNGKPFTNFALSANGVHVGEALGAGRFTVLAPTLGPSGNPYQSINRAVPVEVESLEAIGIYPKGANQITNQWTDVDWALSYLKALHPSRADNYEEWLKVGMALHSIDQNLIHEWDAWSRQSAKYQPGECQRKWASFQRSGVGIGTLFTFAKLDGWQNPYYSRNQHRHLQTISTIKEYKVTNQWNVPVSLNGEIGWLVEEDGQFNFHPKCNFDFQVERELSSEDGGGLVLQVQRSVDPPGLTRRMILHSIDYSEVTRFVDAMKVALGCGIVCNLKKEHLGAFIHSRIQEYRDRGGKLYRLSEGIGQQSDGTWVFADCQYTADGEPTTEEESGWIFNNNIGGVEKMPLPEIAPPDPEALPRLLRAMQKFHGSGIYPALMVLGYVAAGVHYRTIMLREKCFPLINLVGDPGSNKSVAANNALSLVGWLNNRGVLHRASVSATYETLKLAGSLPLCLDDPQRSRELDELLKGLFNAVPRKVRGNYQEPHSPLIVCSNHAVGDDQPATLSRLIQVPFYRVNDGDKTAWDEMQQAQRLASGALPDLIKLGYPVKQIRALANELRSHLPYAHARIADSLGLITWYAQAVAKLANFKSDEIKSYVVEQLCKTANDADSVANSLTDFLDKLNALHAESLIGMWSVRVVETSEIGKALAINMSTVWPVLDRMFAPIYSRKVIEALIDKAGGRIKSVQKFHRSKDESLTYQRLLITPRTDVDGNPMLPKEPEMVSRRCCLLPINIVSEFISLWYQPNQLSPNADVTDVTTTLSESTTVALSEIYELDINESPDVT